MNSCDRMLACLKLARWCKLWSWYTGSGGSRVRKKIGGKKKKKGKENPNEKCSVKLGPQGSLKQITMIYAESPVLSQSSNIQNDSSALFKDSGNAIKEK